MNVQRGKPISPPQISAQPPTRTVSAPPPAGLTPPPQQISDFYNLPQHTYHQTHPTYADMSNKAMAPGRMTAPGIGPGQQTQFMRQQSPQYYNMEPSQEQVWGPPNQAYYVQQRPRMTGNGGSGNAVYINAMPYQMPPTPSYTTPQVQIIPQSSQFMYQPRMSYPQIQTTQQQLNYMPQQFSTQGGTAYPSLFYPQMAVPAPNPNRPPSTGPQVGISNPTPFKREKKSAIIIQDPKDLRDVTDEILHTRGRPSSRDAEVREINDNSQNQNQRVATEFATKVAALLHTDKPAEEESSEMYSIPSQSQGLPQPHIFQHPYQQPIMAHQELYSEEVPVNEELAVVNGDNQSIQPDSNEIEMSLPCNVDIDITYATNAESSMSYVSSIPVKMPIVAPEPNPVETEVNIVPREVSPVVPEERTIKSPITAPVEEEEIISLVTEVPLVASQTEPENIVKSASKESTPPIFENASKVAPVIIDDDVSSKPLSSNPDIPKEPAADSRPTPSSNPKDAKKSNKKNKKDLNKRGEAKEGSEMDAFAFSDSKTEEKTEKTSKQELDQNLVTSTPVTTSMQDSAATFSSIPNKEQKVEEPEPLKEYFDQQPSNPEQKFDVSSPILEVKSTQMTDSIEKPEAMMDDEDMNESTPADKSSKKIVNGIKKYTYKEDQWSPLNPEGKRQYDRDFLIMLQGNPESCLRPANLPDLPDIVLDKPSPHKVMANLSTKSFPDFTPGFFVKTNQRTGGQNSLSKRGSQTGRRTGPGPTQGGGEQRIIRNISINLDIHLHKAENAYKPGVVESVDKDQAENAKLYRQFKAILNKLTPQKFSTLVQQALTLEINTEERMKGVTDLIFEKALSEPTFSVAYANMCKSMLTLTKVPSSTNPGEFVQFRTILLTKCQREFESDKTAELDLTRREQEIEAAPEEKKAELKEALAEATTKARRRSLGNIRFIGELFKLKMLTENIMHDCVFKLLKSRDDESLECLCRLLTTIGRELETPKAKLRMDQYFQQMNKIKEDMRLISRVRFMIQDVIDLRQNNWVPRRTENKPTTIDQIHKEAAQEQVQRQIMLNTPMPKQEQTHGGGRGKGGKGGRGSMSGAGEDGWNTVSTAKAMRTPIDASKMKLSRPNLDETNIQLGPGGGGQKFSQWGRGSQGGGSRSQEQDKPPTNRFNLLNNMGDDGRRPVGRSPARGDRRDREGVNYGRGRPGNRGSQESERDRAVASVRSLQPTGSGSSNPSSRNASRDNSRNRERPETIRSAGGPDALKMSSDQIDTKIKAIVEEYLHVLDVKEATDCVAEWQNLDLSTFVGTVMNLVLERSSQARLHIGEFLFHLVKSKILDMKSLLNGLKDVMECAEDYEIDVPKIWDYLGELIGPLVLDNSVLSLTFLSTSLQPLIDSGNGKAALLIAHTLKVACQHKPHSHVSAQWRASGLKLKDFVKASEYKDFVKQKDLQWLESDAEAPLSPPPSSSRPSGWVADKLTDRLREKKTDNEKIFDWIESNVSEEEQKSKSFIRELMTAVCHSAISGTTGNAKLLPEMITTRRAVLLKYLENRPELELQALFALQALVNKLEHPPGLLRSFFDTLYDEEIISEETFTTWEKTDEQSEGKAIALLNTQQFFVWLREGEEDS